MIGLYLSINSYNIQGNIIFFRRVSWTSTVFVGQRTTRPKSPSLPGSPLNYVILTFYLNYINALLKSFGTLFGIKHLKKILTTQVNCF